MRQAFTPAKLERVLPHRVHARLLMLKTFVVAMAATMAVAHAGCAQAPLATLTRPIEYYNPDWSPDGRALVFESTLDGKFSIYRIGADGNGLQRLTANNANNEQPRWSPDGRRIVFSSDRDGGHLDLYAMNADGSAPVRLTTTAGGGYYQSSFSPDGQWILFQGRPDNKEARDRIFLIRSDGTGWRQLTDSSYSAEAPRWAPDGKTITFRQVPYQKRFWAEMGPEDMAAAHRDERIVAIRPDGSGLTPVAGIRPGDSGRSWSGDGRAAFFRSDRDGAQAVYMMDARGTSVRRVADAALIPSMTPSPNGRQLAYAKQVEGWSGVYVYDVTTRREHLITGGRGAGPLGYLRTATLTAGSDTLDTYTSTIGGRLERGNGAYLIRAVARTSNRRWELRDTWFDSSGSATARQYSRTAPGSLATELETVRAPGDSASLLISSDRVTAWVVPEGKPPALFDAPATGERYGGATILAAIAASRPAAGQVFVAPVYNLYGGNPVATRLDSMHVVRRDTLQQGAAPIAVLVIERPSGGQTWVEESTGREVAARGSAGPNGWWWHIRRGVQPPKAGS
jgi:dipeptidyl aminopeptidase/acylaminoacyl peptidase